MTRLFDRLIEETRASFKEAESEGEALLADASSTSYRQFLARMYGFVFPLERSLVDLTGLAAVFDVRRLRKHKLLEHDLLTIGLKPGELKVLPQYMSVPLFDDVRDALGWAFLIERSTLGHPTLFRRLATTMPGEIAFASSYLKCYFGAVGEMWRSFGDSLQAAAQQPGDEERIMNAAKASYRHFRRWRATLDGKVLSQSREPEASPSSGFDVSPESRGPT